MSTSKIAPMLVRAAAVTALVFFGSAMAQAPIDSVSCPPPPMQLEQQMAYVANAPARNAGFLWRMEKGGRVSWLYGTMHLNHIDYAKPGPQIMMAMRSSDVLAVEINPLQAPAPSVAMPRFEPKLSEAQLARITRAYARECITVNPATVAAAAVTMPLLVTQAQRQGLLAGYSPDARLVQIAQRTGKPLIELETIEQQLAAMAPRSQTDFDEAFQVALGEFESGKMQSDLLQLNQAWRQSAWEVFVKLEQDITSRQPEFSQRLLDQRNILMAQKIDDLHRDGKRIFVALGVLHMAGKAALPKLMQDKGYSVASVPLRN